MLTAIEFHQRGELAAAERIYRELLAGAPRCFDVLHLLGALSVQNGELAAGIALLQRAIDIDALQANAHANLAKALLDAGDATAALHAADRAVALKADYAEAWYNRAAALQRLGRLHDAVTSYESALERRPGYPAALNNLGSILRELRQPERALSCFELALGLDATHLHALNNLGLLYLDLRRTEEALASFDRALEFAPDFAEALHNRGNALLELRRYPEAAEAFERLAAVAPGFMFVHGNLLHARLQSCDWHEYHALVERVTRVARRDGCADLPFAFLCVSSSAELQLRCARAYTASQFPAIAPSRAAPEGVLGARHVANDPIRVAYVSGDLGAHAVSYLLAGVFELHDRSRFEITAISWGRREDGLIRRRLEASFDRFIDVTSASDDAIVTLMRELEIDIAVDLAGHTREQRTGLFARRVAPVQVNFLGLPGTMGASYMDYLIADRELIPEIMRPHYAEQVVWMPETFQPNDASRATPVAAPRASFGLPATGLVLCCFNAPAKLNPPLFGIWMRLLKAVPDSILWLLATHSAVADNLRREAALNGVAAHRLVFASRVDYALHLGRYAHADLFLDSLPFNAGATASDALSHGVPVLTCAGDSFASRMGTSLLTALGLAELVTENLASYEALALALIKEPTRLLRFRARLEGLRSRHACFDTDRYRRHLESAFREMWQRDREGLPPAAFAVAGQAATPASSPRS